MYRLRFVAAVIENQPVAAVPRDAQRVGIGPCLTVDRPMLHLPPAFEWIFEHEREAFPRAGFDTGISERRVIPNLTGRREPLRQAAFFGVFEEDSHAVF